MHVNLVWIFASISEKNETYCFGKLQAHGFHQRILSIFLKIIEFNELSKYR